MVINNRLSNSIGSKIDRIGSDTQVSKNQSQKRTPGTFGSILKEKLEVSDGVKFSKHAELRLKSRNINLSDSQLARINDAVQKAGAKGVKDTLVLTDSAALVVNVGSKTVITAMDREELKDNVFTNIDGAVIT